MLGTVLFGMFLSPVAMAAAEQSDMYQASVIVPSKTASGRQQGFDMALTAVLRKVSGLADVTKVLQSTPQFDASKLVHQYGYEAVADNIDGVSLQVRFDEQAVNKLLHEHDYPIWGESRPNLMILLAVDQDGQRHVLGDEDQAAIDGVLRAQMRDLYASFGVPTVFPLLDLTDQRELNVATIWARDKAPVAAAGARYDTDAALLGRVYQKPDGRWHGDWRLLAEDDDQIWQTSDFELSEILQDTAVHSSGLLSHHFAVAGSNNVALRVKVAHVDSIQDYVAVLSYFKDLDMTSVVRVEEVSADNLSLTMQVKGGLTQLRQALKLGRKFRTTQQTGDEPSPQRFGFGRAQQLSTLNLDYLS